MKIGIYTFFSSNYGAALQAYSLQSFIRAKCPNSEVSLIDYVRDNRDSLEKVFFKRSNNPIYNLVWQFFVLFRYREFKQKVKNFSDFKAQIPFTNPMTDKNSVSKDALRYDILITGSDQVFKPSNKYKDIYYLSFEKDKRKKIAYAPSFGVSEFSDEDKKYIKTALSDFDALSCRETDGSIFLSELLDREVPSVLDPVFLTPKSCWRELEIKPGIEDYVFVYCLKDLNKLLAVAKNKFQNKKIIVLAQNYLKPVSGCKQVFYPGPREFLGLIDNAHAIVTDSFHGMAFSIIFNKDFNVVVTRQKAASRIQTLLEKLDLNDKLIKDENNIDLNIEQKKVKIYSENLNSLVKNSEAYLLNALYSTD
jgi:hypothetical protein